MVTLQLPDLGTVLEGLQASPAAQAAVETMGPPARPLPAEQGPKWCGVGLRRWDSGCCVPGSFCHKALWIPFLHGLCHIPSAVCLTHSRETVIVFLCFVFYGGEKSPGISALSFYDRCFGVCVCVCVCVAGDKSGACAC
jgi:hypothetical protein